MLQNLAIDSDRGELHAKILAREQQGTTIIGPGLAVPHCRLAGIETPMMAAARTTEAIAMPGGPDPADLFFLIISDISDPSSHLLLMAEVARICSEPELAAALRSSEDAKSFMRILEHPS